MKIELFGYRIYIVKMYKGYANESLIRYYNNKRSKGICIVGGCWNKAYPDHQKCERHMLLERKSYNPKTRGRYKK